MMPTRRKSYMSALKGFLAPGLLLMALLSAVPRPAFALIVMNIDPSANYVRPTAQSLPGYVDPDPGWANISGRGVYLGDQWFLATAHTTPGGSLPQNERLDAGTFETIPGTRVFLQNPQAAVNQGFSSNADLIMYRVNTLDRFAGTPEQMAAAQGHPIAPITISSSSPSTNTELVILGDGTVKSNLSLYHWDRDKNASNWPAAEKCVGCLHNAPSGKLHAVGFLTPSSGETGKGWGTNKVENNASVASRVEDFVRVQGQSYYVLDDPDSESDRNTVAKAMDFDEYNFTMDAQGEITGGGGNEVHAAAGDSGSGVFSWNGSEWQLNGLLHAIAQFAQGSSMAIREDNGSQPDKIYGDYSLFSDLSFYREQIESIRAQPEYSIIGDINLDGILTGDGTGHWEVDDVSAFVQGWGWEQDTGDIISWKKGDLNQDGRTDLADFVKLRDELTVASGVQLELAALLGGTHGASSVPEPTSLILAAAGVACLFGHARRARRR